MRHRWSRTLTGWGLGLTLLLSGGISLATETVPTAERAYGAQLWVQEEGTTAPVYQTSAIVTTPTPLTVTTQRQTSYLIMCTPAATATPEERQPLALCAGQDSQTLDVTLTLTPAISNAGVHSLVKVESRVHRRAQITDHQRPVGRPHEDSDQQTLLVPLNTAVRVATVKESETDRVLHLNLILRDLATPAP